MNCKTYSFKIIDKEPESIDDILLWRDIEEIKIQDYLWMNNGYKPEVFIKGCYSEKNIYLFFNVMEKKVTLKYLNTGDPVFKDSCVEFFLNLFPEENEEYFNIELNAIGTTKLGYGIRRDRNYLNDYDLKEMKVLSTITTPMVGDHGKESWQLYYSIPFSVFEKHYGKKFIGTDAIGNFYKCGDETEFPHYGMWNLIESPKPDFHLPEFFGKIKFTN